MRKPPAVDPNRCTGRTTRQMQGAPYGAVFVSAHPGCVRHDRDLAAFHGRRDLTVVAPDWLTSRRWQGMTFTGIVIDHAADLSMKELTLLQHALVRVRT